MKPMMAMTAALLLAGSAFAQQGEPMKRDTRPAAAAGKEVMATGTVKKVDAAGHTVNLAHEAIPSIQWPAMQMDFQVAPNVDLSQLKVGQAIEFTLSPIGGGTYVIAAIKAK